MLHWIWFVVLTLVGWLFAFKEIRLQSRDTGPDEQVNTYLISIGCLLMALIFSWPVIAEPYYLAVMDLIPSSADDLNLFTAILICLFTLILWLFLPMLAALVFMNDDGEVALRHFRGRQIFAWVVSLSGKPKGQ